MSTTDDPVDLYLTHYGMLVAIARSEFDIPEADAELLAHQVFLSVLRCLDQITDPRTWLVAAMTYAARHYKEIQRQRATAQKRTANSGGDWVM